MKKLYTLLALVITLTTFAQAPQGFNYQATVRNSAGALIVNQNVNFKFNIMLNSATSLPIFSETHLAPTDDLGQVNLVIGQGTATTGSFSTINWGTGNYYLGIELNTGSGYVAMGTTQLLSVPYALYANSAGSSQSQGKTSIYLTGDITNAEAAARIASELGPETENIYIRNTTQLTSVDLSSMSSAVNIEIEYNEALTSVNLNGLITIYNNLLLRYNPILTSILFNNLSVSECIRINNNNSLSTISLNSLQKVNRIFYGSAPPIGLSITDNVNLQSVSLPVLINVYQIDIYGNSLLSLDLPSLNKILSGYIYVGNNKLSSTSVNSLLNKFLTVLPSSGKNINLQGQNPPAPPTGQGLIDKQTLIDAGNTVYTDGFVPTVTTTAVTNITTTSATSGGTITNSVGSIITDKGVVWSTSNEPTIENNIGMTTDGSGEGMFTSNLSGLTLGTTYYVRAYATNEFGTEYGQVETFITLAILPTLTTAVSSITSTSAITSGTISSDGGAYISARGIVWSTLSNPTITTNQGLISVGEGIGSFSSTINQLTPGTLYFVRAYATNSVGTAYGNQITFNALPLPTISTTAISSIYDITAISGGTISSNGGLAITARGVCWSPLQLPTIALATKTSDGIGIGSFTSTITGLLANTTYYVRAYATNSAGTAYGSVLTFTTSNTSTTDIDGNTYQLVTIINKTLIKTNLDVSHYRNGDIIPQVTDPTAWANLTTGAWCYYNNDPANGPIYGKLYNWYAVNDPRGLAPQGYHIPTDAEWSSIINFIDPNSNGGTTTTNQAGGAMKESGTVHWTSPNTNANNTSGFTGLPGGSRGTNGNFSSIGNQGFWWSSSESNTTQSFTRLLQYNNGVAYQGFSNKFYGYSVRCIRD